jgi:hypothetical protein
VRFLFSIAVCLDFGAEKSSWFQALPQIDQHLVEATARSLGIGKVLLMRRDERREQRTG